MTRSGISRRTFLRGAGGVAVTLPFLEVFAPRTALGQTAAPPRRFLTFFHPQGTVRDQWVPTGAQTGFALPTILGPLEPWRSRVTIVGGVDNNIIWSLNEGTGHDKATVSLYTGRGYGGPPESRVASGPSIDRVLAQRIGGATPHSAIDLAIGSELGVQEVLTGLFHNGANDPVTSSANPAAVFARLFSGGVPAGGQEVSRLQARRASVLDSVLDSFGVLRRRLGTTDRVRLDAHAEKIRELERRIDPPLAGSCSAVAPVTPPGYNWISHDNVSAPLMIDLMAMAFACDLTRVGTLAFDRGHAPEFPWLNVNGGSVVPHPRYDVWHTMVHDGRSEPGLVAGFRWYTEMFARLLSALDAQTSDSGGSVLDETMVLWLSDFGNGVGHVTNKIPAIFAGNTGGAPLGRFLNTTPMAENQSSQYDITALHLAVLRSFGFNDARFGDPALASSTPMPGLT